MDSIGEVLKQERERRGLSLDDAHEATKITVQSLTALEGDRFESFPNKVYARAFLRDYANFLSLDSAQLLTSYEEKWSPSGEPEPVVVKRSRSVWRGLAYTTLVIVVVGGLGAGAYFAWPVIKDQMGSRDSGRAKEHTVATLPEAPRVAPPKPEAAPKPEVAPKPEPPAVPDKAVLQVTALRDVWIQVKADDKTVFINILPKGQAKTFEGAKTLWIKAGMAGAVQLKFNGKPQPPMENGSLKVRGETTFTLPATPVTTPAPAPAAPSTTPTAAPAPAPSSN